MPPQLLFGLSFVFGLVAWSMLAIQYVWPWMREQSRADALRPLLALHSFRFIGFAFLIPGVAHNLPDAFARPAAYGDLIAAVLALVAMATLRSPLSVALVWLFNVWGAGDLLNALYQGNKAHLEPGQFGAAYFIPTVIVPLLLITHTLMFLVMLRRRGPVHTLRRFATRLSSLGSRVG